jgi:hypothetical protein
MLAMGGRIYVRLSTLVSGIFRIRSQQINADLVLYVRQPPGQYLWTHELHTYVYRQQGFIGELSYSSEGPRYVCGAQGRPL